MRITARIDLDMKSGGVEISRTVVNASRIREPASWAGPLTIEMLLLWIVLPMQR